MSSPAENGIEPEIDPLEGGGLLRADLSGRGLTVFSDDLPAPEAISTLPRAGAKLLRLHTVCPYYTMFKLDFPFGILEEAKPGDWVLDPFCGRGTTGFAARLRGLPSVGVDSNPLAAAVAAAKLAAPSRESVMAVARDALAAAPEEPTPSGPFWELCYHPRTLDGICRLRQRLLGGCSTDAEIVLRAVVLGILHGPRLKGKPTYLSAQMPRTYATKPSSAVRYWESNDLLEPPFVDVLDAIERRVNYVLASPPAAAPGAVYFGDSRTLDLAPPVEARYSWIITSPPYFGMRTYRPDQWLRNWFVGGAPDVDYSSVGQLAHHADRFASELGRVWRNVANASRRGARLVVRFGCLPCCPLEPETLLRQSLDLSERTWKILSVTDAGTAHNGKRQAEQFGQENGDAAAEIDVVAELGE